MTDCNELGVNCPSSIPPCNNPPAPVSFSKNTVSYCNSSAQHDIRTSTNIIAPNNAIMTTSLSLLPRDLGLEAPKPLSKLPASFSWRDYGGNQISRVSNQCYCGCCWAMASTQALADRFGIRHGAVAPELAPAWTALGPGVKNGMSASCQCKGGTLQHATCGFISQGARLEKYYPLRLLTRDSCGEKDSKERPVPVTLSTDTKDCGCGAIGSCDTSIFFAKSKSQKIIAACYNNDINAAQTHIMIKNELLNYGPCAVTFLVRKNFMNNYYPKVQKATSWDDVPVYDPTNDNNIKDLDGGHAVVITGWGSDKDGVPYWEIRNSWGTFNKPEQWRGYFKYQIVDKDPNNLAVPSLTDDGMLSGGAVTCQAGAEWPEGVKKIKGTGGKPVPGNYVPHYGGSENSSGRPNWLLITLISVAVCVVLAVSAIIIIKKI